MMGLRCIYRYICTNAPPSILGQKKRYSKVGILAVAAIVEVKQLSQRHSSDVPRIVEWSELRTVIKDTVSPDCVTTFVMVESDRPWKAVPSYYKIIIMQKISKEHDREITITLSIRQRRVGRR
jgi:hypothetical protein